METKRSSRHWAVLVGCCALCIFAFALPLPCFGVFVSPIAAHFGGSVTAVSLYYTFMTGFAVVSCAVGARFIERNLRATVIIASVIMGAGYILLALFPAAPLVWLAGALAGLCYPLCSSILVPIIISRWFAKRQATFTGIAFALVGATGVVLGPVLTACIQSFGWQLTLVAVGIAIIVACVLTALFLLAPSPEALGVLPYGADPSDADVSEARELTGPPYSRVIKSIPFVLIIAACFFMGFLGDYNNLANSMAQGSGFSPAEAGIAFSCVSAGLFIGKILLGWIRDALGAVPAMGTGCAAGVVAFSLILFALGAGNAILLYAGCLLAGLCTCLGTVGPALLCRDAFGQRAYAQAVGHATAAINLGMAIGAPIYSLTFDLTASYTPVVTACAIVAAAVFVLSFAGVRQGKRRFNIEN